MTWPEMSAKSKNGDTSVPPPGEAAMKAHEPLSEALARLYQRGGGLEEAPGGIGEFGYSRSNPVPTASLEAARHYLGRLRRAGGERVVWTHGGTIAVGLNAKPVFEYAILSQAGQSLATLYLSPGYEGTSGKAPRGFELQPDAPGG